MKILLQVACICRSLLYPFHVDPMSKVIPITGMLSLRCYYIPDVLLKKFTIFLKFKFLKKLGYSVIFFLSQTELVYAHLRVTRVDRRENDEKKKHNG